VLCRFQELQISVATLKHLRSVKLGTLFYDIVDTLQQTLLLQQGYKNKTQKKVFSFKSKENKIEKIKSTELPHVKRFLYSYIAREIL
jgi:hypothetical protein